MSADEWDHVKGVTVLDRKTGRRKWGPKAWDAVRRGTIYCAPACGRDCTFAEFEDATRKAEALAKRLGPRWTPHVHENMGWFYRVTAAEGRIQLHEYSDKRYGVFLNWHGNSGGVITGDGSTAKKAIRDALKSAEEYLQQGRTMRDACCVGLGIKP